MEIETEVVVDEGRPAEEAQSKAVNPITDPDSQIDQKPEEVIPEEKPAEEHVPKGVQKRIDRAVRQKYEAEARAKMLEERLTYLETQSRQPVQQQKVIDNSEPRIENFDNFDEYVRAKAEYIAEQKINQTLSEREKRQQAEYEKAAHQKTAESWNKRLAQATAELPDFEDVLASSDVPMTSTMQQAIMESDIGPRVAYYLAQNPDEATEIARMSPIAAIRTLGRIEERLATQKTVVKVTSAPEPVKPVGSRASVTKDPGKMTDAEYARWRKSGRAA